MPFGDPVAEIRAGAPPVRRIRRIATGLGMIGFTALLIPQGIHTPDQITASLERFATKVMPRFS